MTFEQQFNAAVDAKIAAGMTRGKATSAVVKEDPALHKAMVREANPNNPVGLANSQFRG